MVRRQQSEMMLVGKEEGGERRTKVPLPCGGSKFGVRREFLVLVLPGLKQCCYSMCPQLHIIRDSRASKVLDTGQHFI
jgi:hypothetical protein